MEHILDIDSDRDLKVISGLNPVAKMRTSVAPIKIETGHYERSALTPEQRICHFCALTETEEHVITR